VRQNYKGEQMTKIKDALNGSEYDDYKLDENEEEACLHCGGEMENDRCKACNWNKE